MLSNTLSWCWEQSRDEYTKPVLILSALLIAITWWTLSRKGAPLPPGPWGLPLLGNLPFLEPELPPFLAKLSLKYGPIMKLKLGSRVTIVITSPEAAKEVLKDHDVSFADRDPPAVGLIVTYDGFDMAFAPYGEHWRMMRRVCIRQLLNNSTLKAVYGLRRREVRDMVIDLRSKVGSPIDVGQLVYIVVFKMMTSMMWGSTLHGDERRRVTTNFREAALRMIGVIGEANISDFFPMLTRFDIQGKQRRVKKMFKWFDEIFEFVIDEARKMKIKDKVTGKGEETKSTDFLQVLLEFIDQDDQKTEFTTTHLKGLFTDMTVGGTGTTSVTVEWAMAELLNQPEKMKKAQDELDRVVGPNDTVEESHLSELPYLDAVVKEALRLHSPGPLLIPRRSRESRIIGGYFIPKDAKILVNAWAIHRDPKHWKDPLEFRPERFLESSVEWDYTGNDHRYMPFGSGRRICVAAPVADKSVGWLLGTLLHSFDWKLPEGAKSNLVELFGLELRKKTPLLAVPTARLVESQYLK